MSQAKVAQPTHDEAPAGWNDAGVRGSEAQCLAYIEKVWTDMRPLSLRKAMEPGAHDGADPCGA